MCKFIAGDEKHEVRHELEFEFKENVKLHYSSQPKKSLEEWMSDSEMCNDIYLVSVDFVFHTQLIM